MNRIYQATRRRYTAKDAAKLAGIAYSTIRKHIAEGKLPAKRDGRCLWIEADDLVELYPNFSQPPFHNVFDNADTADESAQITPKSADVADKSAKTAPQSASESADVADESADIEPNDTDKSATTKLNSDTESKVEFALIRQERDQLRQEVEYLRPQVLSQSESIRAISEQNDRLTILLANEQAQRMKALPRPISSWIARLFTRGPKLG